MTEKTGNIQWMMEARLGLFIHWGLYCINGVTEWKRSYERLTIEEYEPYFEEFNPEDYNPVEWARLAKKAGMRYAVLTVKHHEGFCLFDSQYTDYKSTRTKCRRDLAAEFVEAFRAEGLKVGFYYSLFDWHHPDYHHYGDLYHPMRDNPAYQNYQYDFGRYLEYMHNQIRELCTNYGKIDILWFDNSYGSMRGEKWRAAELALMIRSLQPEIVMNNRLECNASDKGSIGTERPTPYAGDFVSPEQIIPPEGVVDDRGKDLPWEACCTMNNSWCYTPGSNQYKNAKCLIRKLVECVSKGGNLLVNIGPNARGRFPKPAVKVLKEMGEWFEDYGKSIYGSGKAGYAKPDWGYYTKNKNLVYAHLMQQEIGPIAIHIPLSEIQKIRRVSDGCEVKIVKPWVTELFPGYTFINFQEPVQGTFLLENDIDTVLEIELK